MKKAFGDIDIDLLDRNTILSKIKHIQASIMSDDKIEPHKTGVYVQQIPIDPITNLASIDYKHAEELGYLKIDFINMGAYQGVRDEEHLNKLLETPVDWALLLDPDIVDRLYHIHNHYDIIKTMKPQSIEQLAMVLAIIRPGKRHLLGKDWATVEKEIWLKDTDGYSFKKSHAIAYATVIVMQLNLLIEQAGFTYS